MTEKKLHKKTLADVSNWAHSTMEPYISLTAHFVADTWKMINILLEISLVIVIFNQGI